MQQSNPSFQFMTAAQIRFGRGEARNGVAALSQMGSSVFLVHGKNGARAAWLKEALFAAGCTVQTFTVPNEPDISLIEEGVLLGREVSTTAVIAIGGGAVIDAGKALAALIPAKRPAMDHLEVVGKGLPLEIDPLPFAALPTTAGTGAEVTKNAVLTVPEAGRKVSLRDERMIPSIAIIDPELTDDLPKAITLASGLDAITQVIEPYLSCKANRLTDCLCRDAIPNGLEALGTLMQGESMAARDALAFTSLCGGMALANAGLGAVHGIAGVMGGLTGAAHGAICGALLPSVLKINERRVIEQGGNDALRARFSQIRLWTSDAIDCPADGAFDHLAQWSALHGLPRLGALGLKRDAIANLAAASRASSSMRGNPVSLSEADLEAVLVAAL